MSMGLREMSEILAYFDLEGEGGRRDSLGLLQVDQKSSMAMRVRIVDVRRRYGTLDFMVTPVAGVGRKWVEARRVWPTTDEMQDAWREVVR